MTTATLGAPVLRAEGVTMRFGGLTAVNGVDLTVNEGEIVGLIGPNGAGKSTTFNLITGLLQANAGEVRFKGQRVERLRSRPSLQLEAGECQAPAISPTSPLWSSTCWLPTSIQIVKPIYGMLY